MNKTLAKLIGRLQSAGQRALEATGTQQDESASGSCGPSGLSAFELEGRVLYSATPVEFVDAQPEVIDVNEMLSEAPELAAMSATLPSLELVISTVDDTFAQGANWSEHESVSLGDPDLDLGDNSDATFYDFFDLADFSADDVGISGMHAVQNGFTFNGPGSTFDLQAGDLVFSTSGSGTLSGNSTSIDVDQDFYVFRPDALGQYDSGEFHFLATRPGNGVFSVSGLSLIDKPGGVDLPDGTTIPQGTIIFGTGTGPFNFVQAYEAETDSEYSIVPSPVFNPVGINSKINAVHVIPEAMSYGGVDFQEGDILISIAGADNQVGSPSVSLVASDIALLRLDSSGNFPAASIVLDGSDVGLGNGGESIDAITFAVPQNAAPTAISIDNLSIDENTDTSSGAIIGTLSAVDSQGGPFTFEVVGPSPFSVSGDQLILTGATLDFETTPSYPVTVRVTDPGGASFETTLTIDVNDVNDPPVASDDFYTIAEDTTLISDADWTLDDWTSRQILTIDNSGLTSDLIDFPVLVNLDSSIIDYSQVQTDGADLRFTDAAGNLLSYEIEEWDPTGTSHVWVRLPVFSASNENTVLMYYGNAAASAPAGSSADVWSNSYDSAWHFGFEGANNLIDSAGNYDGVGSGVVETDGVVGSSLEFGSPGSVVELAADSDLFSNDSELTFNTWISSDSPTDTRQNIFSASRNGGLASRFSVEIDDGGRISVLFRPLDVGNAFYQVVTFDPVILQPGQWYNVSVTIDVGIGETEFNDPTDPSNPNRTGPVRIFVDGKSVETTLNQGPSAELSAFPSTTSDIVFIGLDESGNRELDGQIDELRLSDVVRSDEWIQAQFESWNDSLVSFSGEENPQGVLRNDVDIDSNDLTVTELAGPTNAQSFTLNSDGSFTYVPNPDFNGQDSFTYTVSDVEGQTDVGTATITVTPVNDAPAGFVDIGGFPTEGQTLTASEAIVDVDGVGIISWQWQRDGIDIPGETNSTYTLTPADVGADISVVASYTDDDGTDESVSSTNIGPINASPTITLTNVVSSVPEDTSAQTLIADIDIANADANSTLVLSGNDAALFEIVGSQLYLRANSNLDFETMSSLDVTVSLADPTLPAPFEDFESHTLGVTDVNEAPSITLTNLVTEIEENTTTQTKVADIVVDDDALGSENLIVGGADAAKFEIIGMGLYLRAGQTINFEVDSTLDVSVSVDDPTLGATPDDSSAFGIDVVDLNEAPTVTLANIVDPIPETSDTSSPIKIADIEVADDARGTNNLILAGADAASFRIVGNELFLRAGTNLDFENNPTFDVTVEVDDPSIGALSEDSVDHVVNVGNVNGAPMVSLDNVIAELPENTNTSSPIKVADIVVQDDSIGMETLILSGPDQALFQISGNELFLRADIDLDFEAANQFNVTVSVDDTSLGTAPEDSVDYSLALTDINEPGRFFFTNEIPFIPEDTTVQTKVADIVIIDDAMGVNGLSLSGDDQSFFVIEGTKLFLRANSGLDFETNPVLDIWVSLDDTTIGSEAEDNDPLSLQVADVNEAPTVMLTNTLTSISEDTSVRTKVADIVISDDALGSETLTLSGAHAHLFLIEGTELFLIANAGLDFETVPQLDVSIEINDTTIGSGPEDSDSQTIAVEDIDETPQVANPVGMIDAVEDDPDLVVDLANVFSDLDGDSLTLSVGDISNPGVASVSLVGTDLMIDFLDDQFGSLTVDIVASDGEFQVTDTITINVAAENDAPFADDLTLSEISRDSNPAGEMVRDLVESVFSDIDGDSLFGIAIVANDATASEGVWQVKGSSNEWRGIGAVDASSARVVSASQYIRFLPASGFVGTPTPVEFVAIDSSFNGSGGRIVDVTDAGGTTPFSADSFEIGINVRQFGVEVTPTSPLVTSESGQNATFEVVLLGQPAGDVIVPIQSNDTTEGRASTNQLTFTPSNWMVPQIVTVFGGGGLVDDGDQQYEIEFGPVQSDDPEYDGIAIDDLSLVNLDDDEAAILVSGSNLQTSENGDADQFDIQLGSRPTGNVVIELQVSDETEALLSSTAIVFTPNNWNVPQTVTVIGQNDLVSDGDAEFVITATPTSGDSVYNSLSPVEIGGENIAAIGPVDVAPTELLDDAPDGSDDDSDSETNLVDPASAAPVMIDERGVNDIERKPRTFINTESIETQEEELEDPFVANQYLRRIDPINNGNQFYLNRAAVVQEIVNEIGINEEASMSHLWSDLDQLDNQINEESDAPLLAAGATASIASAFTAGYLVWLIRGGWILAGLLSQRAMWNSFNVLAVLDSQNNDDEDSQSLESLVKDPQPEQQQLPTVDTIHTAEMTQASP